MSRTIVRRVAGIGSLILCMFLSSPGLPATRTPAHVRADAAPFLSLTYVAPLGDTLVGQQTAGAFVLGAFGGSITVTSAALVGTNGASYTIVKNTCVSGTVLDGSHTCEVDVQFAPQQIGALIEALQFGSSAGTSTFDISASGLAASLLVSPTVIDFGFQPIGTTGSTRILTLKNPNPVPITLPYDYYPIQEPDGDFNPVSTDCSTIPAHGSCSFKLTFTPSQMEDEVGNWYVVTNSDPTSGSFYQTTYVKLTGIGVQDGAVYVDVRAAFNVDGIGRDTVPTQGGGMDGLGNAYSSNLLPRSVKWSGEQFTLGDVGVANAVSGGTITLPPGQYYGVTLLATAVRGNQRNQGFVATYTDGTSTTIHQSLSDWKTSQGYAGEAVAVATAYRLNADGLPHPGPYYLYGYTLPVDHNKTLASLKLPANRSVVVLSLNLEVAGVPVTADLSSLYNVMAVGFGGQNTGQGIDGLGSAISFEQLASMPLEGLLLAVPSPNAPDAVANVTVPLPSGQFSTLHLVGLSVRGNHANQSVRVNYQDGTSVVLRQGFSDWHTPQNYAHESIAVAMTAKLNPDGSAHPGTYDVYQYDLPIDASKLVESVVLPKTPYVVILSVALKP
jgi:hypothetical protein